MTPRLAWLPLVLVATSPTNAASDFSDHTVHCEYYAEAQRITGGPSVVTEKLDIDTTTVECRLLAADGELLWTETGLETPGPNGAPVVSDGIEPAKVPTTICTSVIWEYPPAGRRKDYPCEPISTIPPIGSAM